MWSIKLQCCQVLLAISAILKATVSNPVLNDFNNNIRDYSVKEVEPNSTDVRTLQKEDAGKYADFAPVRNPIRFKEVPDNALSGSSYNRGLLNHAYTGYGLHGYEENTQYGFGNEYGGDHDHNLDLHIGHHGGHYGNHHDDHYGGHHGGQHHDFGHYHKHFNHALAAKQVLWPIAGIALLGAAAAALVSNPILLQLGVISGRRRRRDTEEDDHDFHFEPLNKWFQDKNVKNPKVDISIHDKEKSKVSHKYSLTGKMLKRKFSGKQKVLLKKAYPTAQLAIEHVTLSAPERHNRFSDEDRFVPVPIKVKNN